MKRAGAVFLVLMFAVGAVPSSSVHADGEPEVGFGVDGVMIDTDLSSGGVVAVSDVLQLSDGALVASGLFSPAGSVLTSKQFIVKYLPSGARDHAFGVDGVVEIRADLMAAFPDGRLLVWSNGTAEQGKRLSIVTTTGQVLPGPFVGGLVSQLLSRPDGSIVATGHMVTTPFGQSVARVVSPSGAVDAAFDGNVDRLFPRSLNPLERPTVGGDAVLLSDGRLVVAVSKNPIADTCQLVAFNAGGGIDTAFGVGGVATTGVSACILDKFIDDDTIRVRSVSEDITPVQVSPDGVVLQTLGAPFDNPRLAMEGTGFSYAPLGQSSVISYDPLGNVDPTFGINGVADLPMFIYSVKVLPSGDLLAIGAANTNNDTLALGLIHASFGTARQPPAMDTTKFTPVSPTRILDTRQGIGAPTGKLGVGGAVDLQVAATIGVPAGELSAVVLNVTATEATQAGYVAVYPSGTRRPVVSNLNVEAGQTAANLVTVAVGGNGAVTLFTSGGTHLVADIAGFYTPAVTSSDGRLQTAAPQRILDTREGLGAPQAKPGAGQQIDVQVTGSGPVPPTGVLAVVLNVTGDQASLDGFVTVWPAGIARPIVSNLNLTTGDTRANLVIVPVGTDGKVSMFTSGGTDLIADVAGWFTDRTAPDDSVGLFVPITPTRVLDTRQEPTAPTSPTSSVTRLIGSTSVVPPDSSVAIVANVTATQSNGAGYITAWPANTDRPLVSNLNTTRPGQTIPNAAIVPLGQDELSLFTQTGAQLIIDVEGWYTNF